MRPILVLGGGPAGLAAAERLAAAGLPVTLATLGHHLGGKASSWRDHAGRVVEHGQHVTLGFYAQLAALLARAGVDFARTTSGVGMRFRIWEDRDAQCHELHFVDGPFRMLWEGLRHTGFRFDEKLAFFGTFLRGIGTVAGGVPESLDDLCFTAWCLQNGLPPSFVRTNAFRCSKEAQLNWPGEISAYAMLQTLRVVGRDWKSAECRFPAGGMSELWWEPIGAHIQRLGGRIERHRALTGVEVEGERLVGLRIGRPAPHDPGRPWFEDPIPVVDEEVWPVEDAVLALPAGALAKLLPAELLALPELAGIPKLRTIAPLGLQVWHRARPTRGPRTVVCGLGNPLGFVLDNRDHHPEYRERSDFGAALHFVGQETGFEAPLDQLGAADEAMLEAALASLRRIPGFEAFDRAGVIDFVVLRHRVESRRYWNAEPGSLRFKPRAKTPIRGLWLAGDWVRTELDFPCMENAVRSGLQAAEALLAARAGRPEKGLASR